MRRCKRQVVVAVVGTVTASTVWCAAPAHAAPGWAAIASSPSREATDYAWSPATSSFAAEAQALDKCTVKQRADDCIVVASGPVCAAVAWDVAEPLNQAHGGIGGSRQAALAAAAAAAGPYANDLSVRCSWDPNPTL